MSYDNLKKKTSNYNSLKEKVSSGETKYESLKKKASSAVYNDVDSTSISQWAEKAANAINNSEDTDEISSLYQQGSRIRAYLNSRSGEDETYSTTAKTVNNYLSALNKKNIYNRRSTYGKQTEEYGNMTYSELQNKLGEKQNEYNLKANSGADTTEENRSLNIINGYLNNYDSKKKQAEEEAEEQAKYDAMSADDIDAQLEQIAKERQEYIKQNGGMIKNTIDKYTAYLDKAFNSESSLDAGTAQKHLDYLTENEAKKEKLNSIKVDKLIEQKLSNMSDEDLSLLDKINDSEDTKKSLKYDSLINNSQNDIFGLNAAQHAEAENRATSNYDVAVEALKAKGYTEDEIDDLADLRSRQLNKEETEKQAEEVQEYATEHPIAASAIARAGNLIGGISGVVETAEQKLSGDASNYGIDANALGYSFTRAAENIDQQVMLDHDWKIGNVDAFDFFYQAGTSTVDNVLRGVLTGGSGTGAGLLMAGQVFTQTLIEDKDNGYSDAKALSHGLIAATVEGITEKYSLEALLKPANAKTVMGKVLKAAAAEGSEEVASNWLNNIYDVLVNGSESDIKKSMQSYIDQGCTKTEAIEKVIINLIGEDAESFLIGGLSGAGMSGGYQAMNSAIQTAQNNAQAKAIGQGIIDTGNAQSFTQSLSDSDLELNQKLYKIAASKANAKNLGKLYQNALEAADAKTFKEAVTERLVELGETNADEVASAVVLQASGSKLSKSGKALVQSKAAQRVLSEYENWGNGGSAYTNEWMTKADDNSNELRKKINTNAFERTASPTAVNNASVSGNVINREAKTKAAYSGQIARVLSIGNNSITYKLTDGSTVSDEDMHFENEDVASFYSAVLSTGDVSYANYVKSIYDGQTGIGKFTTATRVFYNAGIKGQSFEDVYKVNPYSAYLSESSAKAIYNLGTRAAKSDSVNYQKRYTDEEYNKAKKNGGVVKNYEQELSAVQQAQIDFIDELGKMETFAVVVHDTLGPNANGAYSTSENVIHIALDAKDGLITSVLGHELYHYIKQNNAKGAQELRDFVIQELKKNKNFDYDKEIERYRKLYDSKDTTHSVEFLEEEMIADCMFDVFNENSIKRLVNKNKSLAEKIKDFIDGIIELIKGSDSFTKMSEYLGCDSLEKISDMFFDALENTGKNTQNKNAAGEIADGEVKLSVNQNFAKEYDNWDKKDTRVKFYVGTTSDILNKIGVPNKEIVWDSSKIIKIMSKHKEMTDEIIKQVPNILENPIIVMQSKTKSDRITMFGEVYSNNKPILAVLELYPTDRNNLELDEIKIASAYGKDNAQNFINNSVALWIETDKKRTDEWEKRTGLQLPVGNSLVGSDTIKAQNDNNVNSSIAENEIKYSLKGRGYIGKSMSVNAKNAYLSGEKPISKWTKQEMTEAIREYYSDYYFDNDNFDIESTVSMLNNLTVKELQDNILVRSSWHHTGAFYAQTDFYSLDTEILDTINEDFINDIISERKRTYKTEEEKKKAVENKKALQKARGIYEKLDIIYKAGVSSYKTINGLVRAYVNGNVSDEMYAKAVEELAKNSESKVKQWELLPEGHRRHQSVELFNNDKEQFVLKEYGLYNASKLSNKNIQLIKGRILKNALSENSGNDTEIRFSRRDNEYLQAVEDNNTDKAESLVEAAAKDWGAYSDENGKPIVFYHGTKSFGFTEFDLNKMDDKKSIFLTSDNDTASTYSGVTGKKEISQSEKNIDYDKMSLEELAEELDLSDDGSWEHYSPDDVIALVDGIKSDIDSVIALLEEEKKTSKYKEKIDELIETCNKVKEADTLVTFKGEKLNTDLYQALESEIGVLNEPSKRKSKITKLAQKLLLVERLEEIYLDSDDDEFSDGVLIRQSQGWYFDDFDKHTALEYLKMKQTGNYALYAKLDNPYVVDVNGKNWNDIYTVLRPANETTFKAEYDIDKGTLTLSDNVVGVFDEIETSSYDNAKSRIARALAKRYGIFASRLLAETDTLRYSNAVSCEVKISGTYTTREISRFASEQGYDGVVFKNILDNGGGNLELWNKLKPADYIAVAFNENAVKSADTITYDDDGKVIPLSERFSEDNDIRWSKKDYDYDTLVSKPDMNITVIDDSVTYQANKQTRKYIVERAIKNAASVGKTNENGNAVVYVKDIDTDVIVSKRSITHGLDRRMKVNAPVMLNIGNILKESIIVNELNPKRKNVNDSYILLGVAESSDGRKYIVRFVVNEITNGIDSVDVLYAVNAKKETGALLPKFTEKSATPTVSTISISDLLDIVKDYQQEILSEDVLKHYGLERGNSEIENGLRFSLKDTQTADELVKENEDLKATIETLKREFTLTDGHRMNEEQVASMAKGILRKTSSSYDSKTLAENLTKIFEYIANDEDANYDVAIEAMADLAKGVLSESSVIDKTLYDDFSEMRKYFRETAIRLSDVAKQEIGDYNSFRKENFGRINLRNNGTELDALWGEISGMFPEFFPADAHEAEQALLIADALDAISPRVENPYGYNLDEAAYDLALDMYDKYFNIAEIHTFADKQKAEITRLRGEYNEKMRAKHLKDKANYEKRLKEAKEEYNRRIKDLRTNRDEKIARIRAGYANSRIEARRKRIETESKQKLRRQIIKKTKNLNSMLVKPTDQKHIPQQLQKEILSFARAMSETGIFDYRQLDRLKTAYEAIDKVSDEADYDLRGFYDESMHDTIEELKNTLDGRRLSQLDVSELIKLKELVDHINHIVKNENTLFGEERKATVAEKGAEAIREFRSHGEKKVLKALDKEGLKKLNSMLTVGNLKPVYFFKRLGGVFQELYHDIENGESKYGLTVSKVVDKFSETAEKYHFNEWSDFKTRGKKTISIVNEAGSEIKLTVEEALSLYATFKRKQGAAHISTGGFILEENNVEVKEKKKGIPVSYRFKDVTARQLSINDMMKISAALTTEQKAFADEMVKYLSTDMAQLGNEVSMELYGIKKFNEEYYFPITSSRDFLYFKQSATNDDTRIKHRGFTNQTVPNANNPVVISKFSDVWARHCTDMATYYSLAVPLENFNRVYNYKTPAVTGKQSVSVKNALVSAYGDQYQSYINQLMVDLNGGITNQAGASALGEMIGKFKKGAVFMSLSVSIQQPSAIGRAVAMVDTKYFIKTAISGRGEKTWNELKKYSGTATIKDMGYFDTGMGRSTAEWITARNYDKVFSRENDFKESFEAFKNKGKAFFIDSSYRDEFLSWLPGEMDRITWCHIWAAVKAEVAAETGLKKEALLIKAGERFDEVIRNTQVYDSVLSRSQNMRSKDTGMKAVTAFMAEPTTSLNMLADAFFNEKTDKRYAAKAVSAVVLSYVLNAALVSFVYAARDDDEDETFLEKYIVAFLQNLVQNLNPLNLIPLVKDIWNIFMGYDVERADMSLISDLYDNFSALFSDKKTMYEKISGFVGSLAAFIGAPVKNVERDVRACFNLVSTISRDVNTDNETTASGIWNDFLGEYENGIIGKFAKAKTDYEQLYDAIKDGDTDEAETIRNNILSTGKSEKDIESKLKEILQEDERVIKAAEARRNGDTEECVEYQREVIADGFELDSVVSAVNSVVKKLDNAEKEADDETDDDEDEDENEDETSLYSSYDIYTNIASGDYTEANEAIDDIYQTKVANYKANGKTAEKAKSSAKSDVKKAITSQFKEEYLNGGKTERNAIKSRLKELQVDGQKLYDDRDFAKWEKSEK